MDDTANDQASQKQPQEQTATSPQSAYDNNKVIFILLSFILAIAVVGAGFYFVYNNLQKTRVQPTPQTEHQELQNSTVAPTNEAIQTETAVATLEPTIDDTQNRKRKSDLQQLQIALQKYKSQRGEYPTEITTTPQMIAKEGANLCPDLTPAYLQTLPIDPLVEANSEVPIESFKDCNSHYAIGYMVSRSSQNKITLTAPFADQQTISITF